MQADKRIVIPGGTGFLGSMLTEHLAARGYEIVVLTRSPGPSTVTVRQVVWDGASLGAWAQELEGATAVINLAGRSVNCRYNESNRRAIYASRLRSTAVIGVAIAACRRPPHVWLNSSSATIYRDARDRPMDETTGEIGAGFSVDVCQKWEQAFAEAATPHTRKVALRTAIVFGHGRGGPFEAFHRLVRYGLGGKQGDGTQYVSWIHSEDFARAITWLLAHESLSGVFNLAALQPLPNHEFMHAFRQACHQPIGLPATKWMLELGAFFLRTETELLLKSRRVVPRRLLESGFQFNFSDWHSAVIDLVNHAAPEPVMATP